MEINTAGAVTDLDRPPTPFNLTVRPFRNSLHISWSVASSERPADYHIVEYRTVGQWVPLTDRIASGVSAYNWTTASRGATYHFRVIGYYDRGPADAASTGSDEAPSPDDDDDDDDDGQSPAPWQQSLPSAVVTILTGGQFDCCFSTVYELKATPCPTISDNRSALQIHVIQFASRPFVEHER